MSNLELEKIHRIIFQKGQQKLEEEKKKFPAINNQITEKNINEFFEFYDITEIGSQSPKSISTSFQSEKEIKFNFNNEKENKKIDYLIKSFGENEDIPDLYTPLGKISGNNYELNQFDPDFLLTENPEKNEIKTISKKRLRYFDLDFDLPETLERPEIIITKLPKSKDYKKHNFFHNNNKFKTPFNGKKICHICLSSNHSDTKECPIYKRCYKCLKYGHWAKDCKEIIQNKCTNCNISAHNKEDCLLFNEGITFEDLLSNRNKGLNCYLYNKKTHLICPFSRRENFILNNSKQNKEQNKDKIKDFSKTLFCPLCGGNHLLKECHENIQKNNNNDNINNMNDDSNYLNIFNDDENNFNKTHEEYPVNNKINMNMNNDNMNYNKSKIGLYKNNWINKKRYNSYKFGNYKYMNNKRPKRNLYDYYKKYKYRNESTYLYN